MKHLKLLSAVSFVLLTALTVISCSTQYDYQTVSNDSLNARIYTLENGLKVYMTVNRDTPRIQTYVAVHVGAKNDPSETTGLAHYFEHLMFKGSEQFGTQNYELEKPMLDKIEELFEIYRVTTDPVARKAIYHQIDSVSLEASKLAIPNEYDKLMAGIGSSGSNAWTSYDETVYTEDIPSNQLENWAKIQSDRFAHNVIRGFHTELETVYEEMNMSLTDDSEKVFDKMFEKLFPNHPYGQHSVIGKQDHLKNPSITNIKKYYKQFYVPNNIAICLSGDFDPDQTIKIIDQYFGQWPANPDKPVMEKTEEEPITVPIKEEVWGLETENVNLAWRGPNILSSEDALFNVFGSLMSNGTAGIIDLDIMQQQKALSASSMAYMLADRSVFALEGTPKQGQSLDELKDLLMQSLDKVRKGDFDQEMIDAVVNNYKLQQMRQLESNRGRAQQFVTAFINDMPWQYAVDEIKRMEAVTKDDVVAFANKYFTDDNYVIVYKRQGPDNNIKKIEKPEITPIYTNRDTSSQFLKDVLAANVAPIEPVFVDFNKEFQKAEIKPEAKLVYVPNKQNSMFNLSIVYPLGVRYDKALEMAFTYLDYLGTSTMSAQEIQKAFYKLACSYSTSVSANEIEISLSGLSENMAEALALVETLLTDAQSDENIYKSLVADALKQRADAKTSQNVNFSRLQQYAIYGPENISTNILSQVELQSMNPQSLIEKVKSMAQYGFTAYYYGPDSIDQVASVIKENHTMADALVKAPECLPYQPLNTTENVIYLAQYDANQMTYATYSNRANETFESVPYAQVVLYNEYFGSSMNAIVFQEMREARGLAYSARASYAAPTYTGQTYSFTSYIATQNDKMAQAMEAFHDIINNMPQSEKSFNLAKEGLISNIRSQRIVGRSLISSYRTAERRGIMEDLRKTVYEKVPSMTMQDIVSFQQQWIKERPSNYAILSDLNVLDMKELAKYGKIVTLSSKDIFGY